LQLSLMLLLLILLQRASAITALSAALHSDQPLFCFLQLSLLLLLLLLLPLLRGACTTPVQSLPSS
jgi:hypothetical protein